MAIFFAKCGNPDWNACLLSLLSLSLSLDQVRYTGYRDRPLHERQTKFQHALRDGNVEIVSEQGNAVCASKIKKKPDNQSYLPTNSSSTVLGICNLVVLD